MANTPHCAVSLRQKLRQMAVGSVSTEGVVLPEVIDLDEEELEAASGLEPESRRFADPTVPPDPTPPNVIKPTTPCTYGASALRA